MADHFKGKSSHSCSEWPEEHLRAFQCQNFTSPNWPSGIVFLMMDQFSGPHLIPIWSFQFLRQILFFRSWPKNVTTYAKISTEDCPAASQILKEWTTMLNLYLEKKQINKIEICNFNCNCIELDQTWLFHPHCTSQMDYDEGYSYEFSWCWYPKHFTKW